MYILETCLSKVMIYSLHFSLISDTYKSFSAKKNLVIKLDEIDKHKLN